MRMATVQVNASTALFFTYNRAYSRSGTFAPAAALQPLHRVLSNPFRTRINTWYAHRVETAPFFRTRITTTVTLARHRDRVRE